MADDEECPICYQSFTGVQGKRTARRLPCGCRKSLCQSCIDHILNTTDSCPFCRGILVCRSGRELPICDTGTPRSRALRTPSAIYIGSPYGLTTERLVDMQQRLQEVRRFSGRSRRHRSASDLVQEALQETSRQLDELDYARLHTPRGKTDEDVNWMRPATPQWRPPSRSGSRPNSAMGSNRSNEPQLLSLSAFQKPLTARPGSSSRPRTPRRLGVCRTPVPAFAMEGDGMGQISLSSLYQGVSTRSRPMTSLPSHRQTMKIGPYS